VLPSQHLQEVESQNRPASNRPRRPLGFDLTFAHQSVDPKVAIKMATIVALRWHYTRCTMMAASQAVGTEDDWNEKFI
jgi:hypothetical protein